MELGFEELVTRAERLVTRLQKQLPAELRGLACAVPVHYERAPSAAVLDEGFEPDILGLFSGHPHGAEFSQSEPAPPQVWLYLGNLWNYAEGDLSDFDEELRLTYLHELGHYLGWDEDALEARGL